MRPPRARVALFALLVLTAPPGMTTRVEAAPPVDTKGAPPPPEALPEASTSGAPDARAMAAAQFHYDQGMKAYDMARYRDAARSFDAAYAALDRPVFLLNAARAWELTGAPYEALVRFKQLVRSPEAPEALVARAQRGVTRSLTMLSARTTQGDAAHHTQGDTRAPPVDKGVPSVEERGGSGIAWEWFGVRLLGGAYNLSDEYIDWVTGSYDRVQPRVAVELVLFTMLWDSGYWDILRVGSGWPIVLSYGGGKLEAGARMNIYPACLSALVGLRF